MIPRRPGVGEKTPCLREHCPSNMVIPLHAGPVALHSPSGSSIKSFYTIQGAR